MIDLLLKLSPRERGLLAIAVLLILPLAGVFGALLPLQQARSAALHAEVEARALQDWVGVRVAEKQALERSSTGTDGAADSALNPIGSSRIEQALIAAQLRQSVSALGVQGAGGIELRFEQVDFLRLANWLTASHPGWGYTITHLRLEALETPGTIAAQISLSPGTQ